MFQVKVVGFNEIYNFSYIPIFVCIYLFMRKIIYKVQFVFYVEVILDQQTSKHIYAQILFETTDHQI